MTVKKETMTKLRSVIVATLFAAVVFIGYSQASGAGFKTSHVVILVMDGARWTETWGEATHTNIPVIAKQFAPQGVICTHFRNEGKTETNPGHVALSTGVQEDIKNDGSELPKNPGLFQYFRKQTGRPADDAVLEASKDKLRILADCTAPEWAGKYAPRFSCGKNGDGTGGYRDDQITFEHVMQVLSNQAPAYLLINFKDPDSAGHAKKWDAYLKAIQTVDDYAGKVWSLIQSHPKLKDTTTLFVVNDHGRHTTDFKSHGDDCEGCRHILCAVVGPDIKKGVVTDAAYDQRDVAATAAQLLGIQMPTSQGKVMSEILAGKN